MRCFQYNADPASAEGGNYSTLTFLEAAAEAARLYDAAKDYVSAARTYESVPLGLDEFSPRAVAYFELAIGEAKKSPDRVLEAEIYRELGIAYRNLRKFDESLAAYNAGLRLAVDARDVREQGILRQHIGALYDSNKKPAEARRFYLLALADHRTAGNASNLAQTCENLALLSSQLAEARSFYEQSITAFHAAGTAAEEARIAVAVADRLKDSEAWADASDYYRRAKELRTAHGDKAGAITAGVSLAALFGNHARYWQSLTELHADFESASVLNDPATESSVMLTMAAAYYRLGAYKLAAQAQTRAESLARRANDKVKLGLCAILKANLLSDGSKPDEALKSLDEAVRLLGPKSSYTSTIQNNRAYSLAKKGRYGDAIGILKQAIALNKSNTALYELNIGIDYGLLKRWTEEEYFLNLAQKHSTDEDDVAWRAHSGLVDVYESRSDLKGALNECDRAIGILARIFESTKIDTLQMTANSQSAGLYEQAIRLAIKSGSPRRAFEYYLQYQGRVSTSQLLGHAAQIDNDNARKLADLRAQLESELDTSRQNLAAERRKTGPDFSETRVAEAEAKVASASGLYDLLLVYVQSMDPRVVLDKTAPLPTLQEIQAATDPSTTLLCYFTSAKTAAAFVVTKSSLRCVSLPTGFNELNMAVADVWAYKEKQTSPELLTRLQLLYNKLVAPIRSLIRTPVVAIVPYLALRYLPFATLRNGDSYFGDEVEITMVPSVAVWPKIAAEPARPEGTVLAIAQAKAPPPMPVLQKADAEATYIAKVFHVAPMLSNTVTKPIFLNQAVDAAIVHIAAHGRFDPYSVWFDSICLAPDIAGKSEPLAAYEVASVNLSRNWLVVLSACETQRGYVGRADDYLGLVQSFLIAGAPSVVGSLWPVKDSHAFEFMQTFYDSLRLGRRKSRAMQDAQRAVRKHNGQLSAWASYVLTGSPGTLPAYLTSTVAKNAGK